MSDIQTNGKGLIDSASVRNVKRVILKRQERDSIRIRLSKARSRQQVKRGEVAVIDNREFLRVDPSKFNGSFWLELDKY